MQQNVQSIKGLNVTNSMFLKAIFGEDYEEAHVTSFIDDPSDITADRRGLCWGGGSARARLGKMTAAENQYFCISLFNSPRGQSQRRKGLFDSTWVIVADDVEEKLPVARVERLPEPSYKLVTSKGSEQWGWILAEPETNRGVVENLLDGLVAQGLAPDGVDPGMKGVTRYVRLPEGSNTKERKKDSNGNPFKCYISEWNPGLMYTCEELANVFGIDLYVARGVNVGGGLELSSEMVREHPLFKSGLLHVTGVGSDGWIRVDCVNGDKHTGDDVSGAAVQIKEDGTVFYQCHHGHCNGDKGNKLTGARAVEILDKKYGTTLKQDIKDYKESLIIAGTQALIAKGVVGDVAPVGDEDGEEGEQGEFNPLDWIYLPSDNRFYRVSTGVDISPVALDSLYLKQYPKKPKASEVLLKAMDKRRQVADGLCWVPMRVGERYDVIVQHDGKQMVNRWGGYRVKPVAGAVGLWLELMNRLFPDMELQRHVLRWFAHIFQRPRVKLQWHIIYMGSHGMGKDSLLKPLMGILGRAGADISAEMLESGWGDYFAEKSLVSLQEIYRPQDKKFANTMKNYAASTGSGMKTWNLKGGRIVSQPDTMAMFAFSNHKHCIALDEGERRYLVFEQFNDQTDTETETDDTAFFDKYHEWADSKEGQAALFDYLLNVDLTGFTAGRVPVYTPAYYSLVEGGKADYESTIEDMAEAKEGVFSCRHFRLKTLVGELQNSGHKMGQKGIVRVLEGLGYRKYRGFKKIDGVSQSTPSFYCANNLSELSSSELYDYYFDS